MFGKKRYPRHPLTDQAFGLTWNVEGTYMSEFDGDTFHVWQVGLKKHGTRFHAPTTTVEVLGEETIRKRVTATRLVAVGVFAFAAKKTVGERAIMVIADEEGSFVHVPVKLGRENAALAAADAWNRSVARQYGDRVGVVS